MHFQKTKACAIKLAVNLSNALYTLIKSWGILYGKRSAIKKCKITVKNAL